jgi:hypothetical protein
MSSLAMVASVSCSTWRASERQRPNVDSDTIVLDDFLLDTLAQFDPESARQWFERDVCRQAQAICAYPDQYRQAVLAQCGDDSAALFDEFLESIRVWLANPIYLEEDTQTPEAATIQQAAMDYYFDHHRPPIPDDDMQRICDQYGKIVDLS